MKVKCAVFAAILILFWGKEFSFANEPECSPDLLVSATSSQGGIGHELSLARSVTCTFPESIEHYNVALKQCKNSQLQEEILRELALIHIFMGELTEAEKCCLVNIPDLSITSRANRTLDLASVKYLQGHKNEANRLLAHANSLLKRHDSTLILPFSKILWSKAEARLNSIRRIDFIDYAFEAVRFQKNLLGPVESAWLRRIAEFYSTDPQSIYVARNLLNEALVIDQASTSPKAKELVTLDRKLLRELESRKNSEPLKNSDIDVCSLRTPLVSWSKADSMK